jgi:site-specific DNA recombinase
MIAEYERAKIVERCRRGKLHRARQGAVNTLSAAPYGYLYIRKSETEPARYEVLLPEAKVVRRIFDALVHEQKSIGEIVRTLNAEHVPTRRGAPRWDRTTVWAILRNPAYMGQAAYGKTEAVERGRLLRPIRGKTPTPRRSKSTSRDKPPEQWIYIHVPPLVSTDIFAAARDQLERNRRLSQRNARGERYLLQGLVVCARCGYAYYGKVVSKSAAKGGRQYTYYRCVGTDAYRFAGGRVCTNTQVRSDQLDDYVWESVRHVLEDPDRVIEEWARRSATDRGQAERRVQRDQAADVLANHERSLKRVLDAYEAGALDLKELTERSERLRARIQQAREELQKAEEKLTEAVTLQAVTGRLQDFAARVRHGLDRLTWHERRQLIRTLVARVEIDAEGATVVYRLPSAAPSSGPNGGQTGSPADEPPTSMHLHGRRDHPALRTAGLRVRQVSVLQHARVQPLPDQSKQDSIAYPAAKNLPQMSVVQSVEKLPNVDLQDPPAVHFHRLLPEVPKRSVSTATGPKAVRAVQEVLFVDGLQHHGNRPLKHLILEGWNPNGPCLPIALRDMHTPHGRCSVRARLRAFQQRAEVVLQVRCVVFRALSVHACRAVLTRAPVRFLEPVDVDVVGERRKRHLRRFLRQFRYLLDFR